MVSEPNSDEFDGPVCKTCGCGDPSDVELYFRDGQVVCTGCTAEQLEAEGFAAVHDEWAIDDRLERGAAG